MVTALGTVFLVLGTICCYLAFGRDTKKSAFAYWGSAFLLFSCGAFLTNRAPYIAAIAGVFSLMFLMVHFIWPLPKRARVVGFSIGFLTFAAALLVAFAGIYQRPSKDQTDIEDRTDWEPMPVIELTPQELLALDWSAADEHSDWPVANLMLELSNIAYRTPVDARRLIAELGFPVSESINAGAMQGYVIDAGDDAIIALRGTENHEYDLLQDLRFLKARTDHGSMHGGFVNGYDPMHDQVLQLLEQFETGDGSQKGDQGGSRKVGFGGQKGDHLSPIMFDYVSFVFPRISYRFLTASCFASGSCRRRSKELRFDASAGPVALLSIVRHRRMFAATERMVSLSSQSHSLVHSRD
jgi:hypothetical protein